MLSSALLPDHHIGIPWELVRNEGILGLATDLLSPNLPYSQMQSSAYTGPILMTIYRFIKALDAKDKDPFTVECVFIKLFQNTGDFT